MIQKQVKCKLLEFNGQKDSYYQNSFLFQIFEKKNISNFSLNIENLNLK